MRAGILKTWTSPLFRTQSATLQVCWICASPAWRGAPIVPPAGIGALGAIAFEQGPRQLHQAQTSTRIARRANSLTDTVRAAPSPRACAARRKYQANLAAGSTENLGDSDTCTTHYFPGHLAMCALRTAYCPALASTSLTSQAWHAQVASWLSRAPSSPIHRQLEQPRETVRPTFAPALWPVCTQRICLLGPEPRTDHTWVYHARIRVYIHIYHARTRMHCGVLECAWALTITTWGSHCVGIFRNASSNPYRTRSARWAA
jgi:hypothetical protein